jgi:hypothetical protein
MKAIITQDTTIVNFENIVNIIIYSGNTFKTKFELRALSANTSNYYTLAVYETRKDAKAVFDILAHWLSTDDPVIDLNFPEYQNYNEEPELLTAVAPAAFSAPVAPASVTPVAPAANSPFTAPVAAPASNVKMSVSGTTVELTEIPVDITVPPVPIELSKISEDFILSPIDINIPPSPFEFPPKFK